MYIEYRDSSVFSFLIKPFRAGSPQDFEGLSCVLSAYHQQPCASHDCAAPCHCAPERCMASLALEQGVGSPPHGEDREGGQNGSHGATVLRLCSGKRQVRKEMAGINQGTLGITSPGGATSEEMHDSCYDSPRGPGGQSSLPVRSPRPARADSSATFLSFASAPLGSDEATRDLRNNHISNDCHSSMTRLEEEEPEGEEKVAWARGEVMRMVEARFRTLEDRLLQRLEQQIENVRDRALDVERVQSLVDKNIDMYHSHLQELLPARPDTQLDMERVQDLIDHSLDVYNVHVEEKILLDRSHRGAAGAVDEVEILEAKAQDCIQYIDNLEQTVMSLCTALRSKEEEIRIMEHRVIDGVDTARVHSPRSVALSPRTPSCSFAGTLEEELSKTKVLLELSKSQKELADQWAAFFREKHDHAVEIIRARSAAERSLFFPWREVVLVIALVLALSPQNGPPVESMRSLSLVNAPSEMAKSAFPNLLGLAAWGLSKMRNEPKRHVILASHAAEVDQKWTATEVANKLLSWSEVVPARHTLDVLGGKALQEIDDFTAEDVTKTLAAYQKLGKPEPKLQEALKKQARAQVGSFNPDQVSMTLDSLSAFGEMPRPQRVLNLRSAWRLIMAGWRHGKTVKTVETPRYFVTAQDVASMIWELAAKGRNPPQELLEAMRKCFIEVNADFSAEELEKTLWAFAELQEAPGPELMTALRTRAVAVSRTFTAPRARRMMQSFAKLGKRLACPHPSLMFPYLPVRPLPGLQHKRI